MRQISFRPENDQELREGIIINEISAELLRAEAKFPNFPTDSIHAVAIMCEEAGESLRAALNYAYSGGNLEDVKTELIQTGAMVRRCLMNIHSFERVE